MIYDYIVSDKLSNNYFLESQNEIKNYLNFGSMLPDKIQFTKKNLKDKIKNDLNISKKTQIVSFFDCTVGYRGIQSLNSYKKFLESIIQLSNQKKECLFFFKCKSEIEEIKVRTNEEILNLFNIIKKLPNCIFLTNNNMHEYNLFTYDLIAISDLVISGPLSSIILHSICGNVKVVVYDPDNEYDQSFYVYTKVKLFRAVTHKELEDLIGFWLDKKNNQVFFDQLNKHIKPNVDHFCDGKAIERFRDYIKN